MTPRIEKPAKLAWAEEITKKVLLKKEGSFVKAIQVDVGRIRKGKVYVPIKQPSVISRSAKAKPGSLFAECEAFTKKLKKGKRSTLKWWTCYLDSCAS